MQPQIIYLDDNSELVELLTEYIHSTLDVPCQGFSSFKDFETHLPQVLKSRIAILDLELGFNQPNGIDAYQMLTDQKFLGKIFFLTGHGKSNPLVQKAMASGATIWEKPMDGVAIAASLREALGLPARTDNKVVN